MRVTMIVFALWLCSPYSALAEAWVEAGWQQVSARHDEKALALWQQGINQLDDKRLLASIGVYAHFPYAMAQLKLVGPAFDTFIARRNQHGRVLYFVLSMRPTPANKNTRQIVLADLKQAADISGILIAAEAGTFKSWQNPGGLLSSPKASTARQALKQAKIKPTESTISFSINRFEISGNKLVSNDMLLMSLSDFYGSGKTRSDLASIRSRIVEIYRMAGVDDVRVSNPQLIDDATVQISIQEK